MSSVNKVVLIGRVGKDPEIKSAPSGMNIANLSLATTQKKKGEEDTQWHRVVFFDKLADIVSQYVTKGSLIYVEGMIKYGKYIDKQGNEKHTVDIVASNMTMLGGRNEQSAPKPAPKAEPEDDQDIPF